MLSKEERNAIRERCEAASSVPWSVHRYSVDDCNGNQVCGDFTHDNDKHFIAHARQDIPALLDVLEATEIKYQCNLEELKQLDSNSAGKDKEYKRELDRLIADRDKWKVRAEMLERAMKGNCLYCGHRSYHTKKCTLRCDTPDDCMYNDKRDWQFNESRFAIETEEAINCRTE